METVGIRELKQNASAVIARARTGEPLTVTDRGHPVALITGLRPTALEQMEHAGLVTPASGAIQDLEPPIPQDWDGPSLSEILEEDRANARY